MKKNRRKIKGNAATTARDWGFGPVPGKGGKTTNYDDGKKEAKGE